MLRVRLTRFQAILAATSIIGIAIWYLTDGSLRWWLLSVVCSIAGLSIGLGVSFPSWQMFGPCLCRVRTGQKLVALTFDDGPDQANTPALLALLRDQKIPATFFCIGERVALNPDLARQIASEGHELENHSWSHHPWTNFFSTKRLVSDLVSTQQTIEAVCGSAPKYFRPPMGLTNDRVFRAIREPGLTLVGYSARGLDRRAKPPEKIVDRLLRGLRPGAILLLHDADVPQERMLTVVSLLARRLKEEGYQCVRLDELVKTERKSLL